MREHTWCTEQTQPGMCWWEGGGGPLSARVSLVISHPPFTFVGDLSTISSISSSCSLAVKPQNFSALLGVPVKVWICFTSQWWGCSVSQVRCFDFQSSEKWKTGLIWSNSITIPIGVDRSHRKEQLWTVDISVLQSILLQQLVQETVQIPNWTYNVLSSALLHSVMSPSRFSSLLTLSLKIWDGISFA